MENTSGEKKKSIFSYMNPFKIFAICGAASSMQVPLNIAQNVFMPLFIGFNI